jgi:hypothetical protein
MQYFETTATELRHGTPVRLEVFATFESEDSWTYTFRLANGVRVNLPKQQRLNDQIMWQGQTA